MKIKAKNVNFEMNSLNPNDRSINSNEIINLRNKGFFTSDILGSGNSIDIIQSK